jgi:hypothetical protein
MTSTSFKRNKTISLEEWEIKTQLSESQRQSVLELQDACAELPLPESVRLKLYLDSNIFFDAVIYN